MKLKLTQTQKPNPAPTLTPTMGTTSTPIAVKTSTATQTTRWETVSPANQKSLASSAPGPTTGSNLGHRWLILSRDENAPLPIMMDQEISSAIHSAQFHHQASPHIRIMNVRRNANSAMMAVREQNVPARIACQCHNIIVPAKTVDQGIVDVERISYLNGERSMKHLLYGTWEKVQTACRRCQRNLKRRMKA